MRSTQTIHRTQPRADHAELVALQTASGAQVELMRASYRTQAFSRHTHDYFTIGVMLQGLGTLWHHGTDHVTRPGDIVVIPPGETHTGGLRRETTMLSYFAVHAPATVLAMCADAQDLRGGSCPAFGRVVIHDPTVGAMLRRLNAMVSTTDTGGNAVFSSPRDRRFNADAAEHTVIEAIELLVRRHADAHPAGEPTTPTSEPSVVGIARSIIEDCYADNCQTSLRSLALRVGVTPCHLVRAFTKATGMSPHRYLVQTRVRRASHLLARGIAPSFVAAMTGFADQSHLTTQFKRYVGTTPASYQRCLAPSASR